MDTTGLSSGMWPSNHGVPSGRVSCPTTCGTAATQDRHRALGRKAQATYRAVDPEAWPRLLEGVGAVPLLRPVGRSAWSHAGERLDDARLGLLVPMPQDRMGKGRGREGGGRKREEKRAVRAVRCLPCR